MSNFDEFIKNKLEEQVITFDQEHWNDALRLIESEKKRKKRRFFIWFLTMGMILTGFIIAFLYHTKNNENESTQISTKKENKNVVTNSPSNQAYNKSKRHSQSEAELSKDNIDLNKIQINNPSETARIGNVQSEKLNKRFIYKFEKKYAAFEITIQDKKLFSNKEENQVINQLDENAMYADIKDEGIKKAEDDILIKEKNKETGNVAVNGFQADKVKKFTFELLEPLEMKKSFLISDVVNVPELLNSSNIKIQQDKKYFNYEIGLNADYNYMANHGKIQLGVYVRKSFDDNWYLSFNLNYSVLTSKIDSTKKYSGVNYSFDRSNYTMELKPTSVHYISLIGTIEKGVGRGTIMLGGGLQKLIGVRGKLINDSKIPDTRERYNTPLWIKNKGFIEMNYPVFVGYKYPFLAKCSFGLKMGYLIGGTYLSVYNFDNNSKNKINNCFIEFGISYRLIKR